MPVGIVWFYFLGENMNIVGSQWGFSSAWHIPRKINDLFHGFEHIQAYLDGVLLTTKNDWDNHLVELEHVLLRLAEAGLKADTKKSFFGLYECEYLGFWVTRDGIRPLEKTGGSTTNLQPPTTAQQFKTFLVIINYHQDMWPQRAYILTLMTKLISSNTRFKFTEFDQKSFKEMKHLIGKDTLLAYPNLSKELVIHMDASETQLGYVISQAKLPIVFYFRKLTHTQTQYTTTER